MFGATAGKSLWQLLQESAQAEAQPSPLLPQAAAPVPPQGVARTLPPKSVQIDDSTNKPVQMVPKSMTVQVKRPMGYARPAEPESQEPNPVDELMQQYSQRSDDAFNTQREGISNLEERIKNYEESYNPWQQMDFGPGLALFDSINKTNLASSYKRPESGREHQEKLINLQDLIQKQKSGLAKEEADALKEKIGLYLKGQNDPEKEMMALVKMQLMNANLTNARNRPGEDAKDTAIQLMNNWRTDTITKNTQEVAAAYEKVQSSASNNSPAGDLSLIFNYMKMLDPGSVVREGEFATAQNAAGVPDRVVNMYNKILNGERLNPTQRKDFFNQAGNTFNAQMAQQERFNQGFRDLATSYGLNPNQVVLPTVFKDVTKKKGRPATAAPTGAPKVGEVIDGMKYLGGDPADPKSWGQ